MPVPDVDELLAGLEPRTARVSTHDVIVLDTTVLIYAVGGEHEFRQPYRDLVSAIGAGGLRASTTLDDRYWMIDSEGCRYGAAVCRHLRSRRTHGGCTGRATRRSGASLP